MNKKTKIIIASICIVALLAVGAAVAMFVMLMNKEGEIGRASCRERVSRCV